VKHRYIFGPIPSRRLGLSLGIDLVPYKTCSLDCVYCECGGTTSLTTERKEYVPIAEVLKQLDEVLKENIDIDFVTFSGAGEPTLNSGIGEIVAFIKDNYPKKKICLLTNGTLFNDEELLEEIKDIDLVIPSLDAVLEEDFQKINKPAKSVDLESMIESMIEFRNKFNYDIWLEIFVIEGINDSDKSIKKFKEVVAKLQPNKVQLNTIDRPGTESWVKTPSPETIKKFEDALSAITLVEVIGAFKYTNKESQQYVDENARELITSTLFRRPCTYDDLKFSLTISEEILDNELLNLKSIDIIEEYEDIRGKFYKMKNDG
jgi:wyosine [tRNA(Phe)-imidazoG37] synthetase (radical SAM superfamily)